MVRPPDAPGLVGLTAQPSSAQPSPARPSSPGQPSRAGRPWPAGRYAARRWGLLLIVGWLVQAGLRAWLSRAQVVPLATPDESAYLIAARVLAGGSPANFSYSTLYPAGYPLLITPVFWFTSNPVTAYHAVLMINAPVSATLMPLGYLACRRLGLDRPAAYGVAAVTALLPAGFFYTEYAMTDAIYPVLVLAWLLTVHSWLTASSARGRYAAAIGSALLAGLAYAVHSRGLVIVLGYLAVGIAIAARRLAPRGTVAAAAVALTLPAGLSWLLNRYLAAVMYPSGARSLSGEAVQRLGSVHGVIFVLEMAAGQLWRFTLDGWGVSGIGLVAAVAVSARRDVRTDLRIMAVLAVAVTAVTAVTAPAALPPDQAQAWASGRYLDGMVVTFFLAGAVVLLRARLRQIATCAAIVVPPTLLAAVAVAAYAGTSVPTAGFGAAFSFAEPAVLTQDWTQANVALATAVALGLLAVWVAFVLAGRWRAFVLAGLAAVSLTAVVQMTSHISQASTPGQQANTTGLITGSGLKPGQRLAIGTGLSWASWMPQAYEIPWTQLEFFDPVTQPPPADATVVEVAWPAGQAAQASWPQAPPGWRIVTSDPVDGWVAWRKALRGGRPYGAEGLTGRKALRLPAAGSSPAPSVSSPARSASGRPPRCHIETVPTATMPHRGGWT